jgi:histidine ammonia-lyase
MDGNSFENGRPAMPVTIDGESLTIKKVVDVARGGEKVELSPGAEQRIIACRAMVERKIRQGEVMYGINTGIGEFSETRLSDSEVLSFQKYLIYNHSAGIGKPAPLEHVRAAMLGRANVHAKGRSAVRPEITQMLLAMLNNGVTPVVCEKGSVGACGDLAPMSMIALVVMGEGEAFFQGERLPGAEALKRAGLEPLTLHARDGLALINGSNLLTAIAALNIFDMNRWLKTAEIATAMSLEALYANLKPYDPRVHRERGFKGAARSAMAIRKCLEGSDLATGKTPQKVQDAYSMRSTPQVIGAAHDALAYAASQVEIELNGVGDNPLFLHEEDTVLTGANFQGTPVSLPMEMAGTAITMVSVLSERRLNRLLNPALSVGLPPFLAEKPGLFSGHMLSQYTAGMLIAEQRMLSAPAAVASIPAAADQEDFVSMGMNTSLKNCAILENARGVLGIELIAAAQALDFRSHAYGKGVNAAHAAVRNHVAHLGEDRPLYPDHNRMSEVVADGEILEAVEAVVGSLE